MAAKFDDAIFDPLVFDTETDDYLIRLSRQRRYAGRYDRPQRIAEATKQWR